MSKDQSQLVPQKLYTLSIFDNYKNVWHLDRRFDEVDEVNQYLGSIHLDTEKIQIGVVYASAPQEKK